MRTSIGKPRSVRVAIYARKSSDDRGGNDVSATVTAQALDCMRVVEREGWELVRNGNLDYFFDDGITGRAWPSGKQFDALAEGDDVTNSLLFSDGNIKRRPGLGAVLKLVAEKEVDIIIARDMPRLARPVFQSHLQTYLPQFFRKHKASVYSLADGEIDYNDEMKMLLLFISEAMVDKELKTRAKHAKEARANRQNSGKLISMIPFGYVRDKFGVILPDKKTAHEVRKMYDTILAGGSLSELAKDFQKRGVPTLKNKGWYPGTIKYTLKNPLYYGYMNSPNGVIPCIEIKEPIISQGIYYAVQEILSKNVGIPNRQKTGGGLASGILRCGNCGSQLYLICSKSAKGTRFSAYRCNRSVTHGCKSYIGQPSVDAFFRQLCLLKPIVEAEQNAKYAEELSTLPELKKQEKNLVNRIAALNKKITKSGMDIDVFADTMNSLKMEIDDIRNHIAKIENLPVVEELYHSYDTKEIEMTPEESKMFFKSIFSGVIVNADDVVFNTLAGESFTIRRCAAPGRSRGKWLPELRLLKHKAAQFRFPGTTMINIPLAELHFIIDKKAIDKYISFLNGKVHITRD